MLHASYFEELRTCLSRGAMYDVIYVVMTFSEKHVHSNWPNKNRKLFYVHCYFAFNGTFFNEVDGYTLECEKRSAFTAAPH